MPIYDNQPVEVLNVAKLLITAIDFTMDELDSYPHG